MALPTNPFPPPTPSNGPDGGNCFIDPFNFYSFYSLVESDCLVMFDQLPELPIELGGIFAFSYNFCQDPVLP